MLKQTKASAKVMEWRQNCFLPQSVILSTPKTNSSQSYFAKITSVNDKCLAAAPTRAGRSKPEWKYTKNENIALTAQNKESSIMFVCCMLQPEPQKRSTKQSTNMFFFLHELQKYNQGIK